MQGHIKRTGKRSYRIFLHVGKGKYKTQGVKGTYRDAERERARLVHELESGTFVPATRMTVGEYLEKFLGAYQVAARTLERHTEIIRRHLIPALGHLPLSKLSGLDIDTYYAQARERGRRDGRGGLDAETVRKHHRVLRHALQKAVRPWRLLARNPADDATPPKASRKEIRIWDEHQLLAGFELFRDTRLYAAVFVAGTTGLRRGELLGLRRADLDLDAGKLHVLRSLEETQARGLVQKEPKTPGSRRPVSLMSQTLAVLRHHLAEQAAARLAAGPAWEDNDLVFPDELGRPWAPSAFTGAWIRRLTSAKCTLPRIPLKNLRHSHATMLLRAGVHPKVVSERLGHKNIAITLNTYSAFIPSMQEEAIAKLDAVLRAAGADTK